MRQYFAAMMRVGRKNWFREGIFLFGKSSGVCTRGRVKLIIETCRNKNNNVGASQALLLTYVTMQLGNGEFIVSNWVHFAHMRRRS